MARSGTYQRIRTYLFGVAIGSALVAVALLGKADIVRRQRAAQAAAAPSAVAEPGPNSAPR